MDTELLVEQQDEGQRLLEQLARDGFDVVVAFWARTSDDGSWHLYIASPLAHDSKLTQAYHQLYTSLNRTSPSLVSPVDLKLLDDDDPIAWAVLELRDRFPDSMAAKYQGKRLGDLGIREAYIYPEIATPRLSFTISYDRSGDTNHWRATVKRGRLYRDLKMKGAVSYSTAKWEGEAEADQRFANVSVLVSIDPKFDHPDTLNLPEMKRMTAEQARVMADEMFRSYHPDAIIEPGDDEAE